MDIDPDDFLVVGAAVDVVCTVAVDVCCTGVVVVGSVVGSGVGA